ncbi:hypothetical protein A0H81_03858 [Grifola frondosa]|uniref:F-box domain-containing protein n=1 Tax=Grifola frondosa TaxID=5627 RepID=A0A1C7MIU7_GRIFR|nr:hypothetical protein A0H81_03858 [Grifola frondosa]
MSDFESLPVELIADILSELDLASLVVVSYLSRRLLAVSSDSSLNPWRQPILRTLYSPDGVYERSLKHLSVRFVVPRQNWVEILSIAKAHYLLFEATLPNLKDSEWEECFMRRFLPSWVRWKKDSSWKEVFHKILHRVWHRSHSSCTSDEAWTKYLLLNRNGSANELEGASRGFSPLATFHEIKLQNNLAHLETHIRLVVEFADVRILALGVLNKPRSSFTVNHNARIFLHPPGTDKGEDEDEPSIAERSSVISDKSFVSALSHVAEQSESTSTGRHPNLNDVYRRLTYPTTSLSHANYPFYTPGGGDKRWLGSNELEERGMQWVGSLMLTVQIIGPHTKEAFADGPPMQDLDLVFGPGRSQYASMTFADLDVIAPWLELSKRIIGPGLGH